MVRHFCLSNVKKHWIFPMLTGILIVSVSLLIVSTKAVSLMKEDKIRESEKIIDTVRKSVDHYLFNLQASAAELILNNQNMVLQSAKTQDAFISPETYRYSELMYNIQVANALIEDIFLYYPSQDYIVGTEGSYSSQNYFLLSSRLTKADYDFWKKEILDSGRSEFFLISSPQGGQNLYFRQQMPAGRDTAPSAVLIIYVNKTEFGRLLDMSLPHDGSTSISVFDNNNRLYQTGSDTAVPAPQELLTDFKDRGTALEKVENTSYIGWKVPSDYSSFYYVVVSSKQVLISYILPIRHLLIAGIILCTMAGLIVSFYLGRRQYLTIEKTINGLNEQMLWSLKDTLLADILNQKLTDTTAVKNVFQTGGIALDYMYYRLVLADVSFEKNKKQIKDWIFKTGTRLEQDNDALDVIPALIGQTAVFLLNYDMKDDRLNEKLEQLFREICGSKADMSHSEEFMSSEQIVSIYEQTQQSLPRYMGQSTDPDAAREKNEKIILKRWNNSLFLREYANAALMLPELFENYVLSAKDSYVRLSRQYEIAGHVLSCLEEEDRRHHASMYPSCLDSLKSCSMQKLPMLLQEILDRLERLNSQYTLRQKDNLAHKIRQIIEGNYTQHYLGLCYISEQVKVSTSYVSKVFKEEYGIGVVEFMNRMRINQAKRIMEKENLTVKEIAEKVGFTSDIHFIRIFKKYENTTPGVYQKQSK